MNLFDPRTFSTDWEIMVVDKLERFVDMEKLFGFSGMLRDELDLPIQIDWNAMEFALGINSSFEQLWGRVLKVTERTSQLLREYDLELFPAAAHPIAPMFNSAHIHVGTVLDEVKAIELENLMSRYTPAFGALAANSPVANGSRGEYKSYRIRECAHNCVEPSSARHPAMTQPTWGTDSQPKMYGGPTFEVRIPDCASSRRFLAELAVFVAAFTHHQGTKDARYTPTPEDYRINLTNRWSAAKHGLQATLIWDGEPRPVTEILDEMLDACSVELAELGVKRSDLGLVNQMIEKRYCQADYVLALADRYPDPVILSSVYAKLMRHWDIFDECLSAALTLDPVPAPDEETIVREHLSCVGEGTHFYRSRSAMLYPPAVADEMIERMIDQGLIRRDISRVRGMTLSRV